MRRHFGLIVLAGVLAATAATAQAGTRIYVRIAPPAPIIETRAVAPGPAYVWIPGYHRWDGGAYVWIAGRWELPPAHRRFWVAGHWTHSPRYGWYWVDGHWRR